MDKRTYAMVCNAMRGRKGRDAKREATDLAAQFGVTVGTIYRVSRSVRPSRKQRSDRIIINPDELNPADPVGWAVGLTFNYDMKAEAVAEIAAANDKGLGVCPATYNRWLREAGISRKHLKGHRRPARQFEAARPNDLWQLDFTRSAQFYIADDGGIGLWGIGERKENKKGRTPLYVATIVDDHSRARYRRGYSQMRAVHVQDFLFRACCPKEDHRHPLCGRPRMIYCDNDPIIWNQIVQPSLDALEIEIDAHLPVRKEQPDAARGTGKVERQFRDLKEDEKISQIWKWQSLDEFNEWLFQLDIRHGNKVHSMTGEMPFGRWCMIRAEELRQMPREEIYERLYRQRFEMAIDGYMRISVQGEAWQLPYTEPFIGVMNRGEKLEIFVNPKDTHEIFAVVDGVEHKISYKKPAPDLAVASGGTIKSAPDGVIDKLRKIEWDDYSKAKRPMPLDNKEVPVWVPRGGRGTEFDEGKMAAPETAGVNRVAAIKQLQLKGIVSRPPTPDEKIWLDTVFAGRAEIPEDELTEVIKRRMAG